MSIYSLVSAGPHPLAGLFINLLGLDTRAVPRLRDAHLIEIDGVPVVRILTRTGGGNREAYEQENKDLQAHPAYRRDSDCDCDSTYAEFFFDLPEAIRAEALRLVPLLGVYPDYSHRFPAILARIEGKEPDWTPKIPTPEEIEEIQQVINSIIEKVSSDRP